MRPSASRRGMTPALAAGATMIFPSTTRKTLRPGVRCSLRESGKATTFDLLPVFMFAPSSASGIHLDGSLILSRRKLTNGCRPASCGCNKMKLLSLPEVSSAPILPAKRSNPGPKCPMLSALALHRLGAKAPRDDEPAWCLGLLISANRALPFSGGSAPRHKPPPLEPAMAKAERRPSAASGRGISWARTRHFRPFAR